ncbi:acyl-CoA desaturase [Pseudofrankia sp. DC12]|uniref:acyl-CoA desaturase n=1 Tax=Pseudofrankia sp. DC12 TaxID=683315 RepID=UPI000A02A336|nr:acyl-CoA desaturase [Pseudofrankia sp. DC12]
MKPEPHRPPDVASAIAGDQGDGPQPPDRRPNWAQATLWAFIVVPFLAVIAGASYAADGHEISLLDAVLAVGSFAITGHGVTVGFHRHLTHGAFKTRRWVRIGLAVAGSMAAQGSVIHWVADHRKHHAFSDRDGDPHSPWRFGTSPRALAKGLCWAHLGWLFVRDETSTRRYAPDLLADPDMVRVDNAFPWLMAVSLLAPAALGWALTGGTVHGAATAFLWAGLVRIFVLHHVTFSVNSICHVLGPRPFATRDRSTNVWPLAVLSMGESWHNAHHTDPTCARHGVDPGQLDSSAALIHGLERIGLAWNVRWPDQDRLAARRRTP